MTYINYSDGSWLAVCLPPSYMNTFSFITTFNVHVIDHRLVVAIASCAKENRIYDGSSSGIANRNFILILRTYNIAEVEFAAGL